MNGEEKSRRRRRGWAVALELEPLGSPPDARYLCVVPRGLFACERLRVWRPGSCISMEARARGVWWRPPLGAHAWPHAAAAGVGTGTLLVLSLLWKRNGLEFLLGRCHG